MKQLLEIRQTHKYGRGLFATRKIRKGEVVEISPIVELENDELRTTRLNVYIFGWRHPREAALALGLGSLFNHSKRANITYNPVLQNRTIIFVASKDIPRGHQCFINYGYDPKYGVEVTERNKYEKLREKFETPVQLGRSDEGVAEKAKEEAA